MSDPKILTTLEEWHRYFQSQGSISIYDLLATLDHEHALREQAEGRVRRLERELNDLSNVSRRMSERAKEALAPEPAQPESQLVNTAESLYPDAPNTGHGHAKGSMPTPVCCQQPAQSRRCRHVTTAGSPLIEPQCGSAALPGSDYCAEHQPKPAANDAREREMTPEELIAKVAAASFRHKLDDIVANANAAPLLAECLEMAMKAMREPNLSSAPLSSRCRVALAAIERRVKEGGKL